MDYGSLMVTTLQRASSAREAVRIVAELTDKYGYASSMEGFSISDGSECWYMELIGKGNLGKGLLCARLVHLPAARRPRRLQRELLPPLRAGLQPDAAHAAVGAPQAQAGARRRARPPLLQVRGVVVRPLARHRRGCRALALPVERPELVTRREELRQRARRRHAVHGVALCGVGARAGRAAADARAALVWRRRPRVRAQGAAVWRRHRRRALLRRRRLHGAAGVPRAARAQGVDARLFVGRRLLGRLVRRAARLPRPVARRAGGGVRARNL